MSDVVLIRAVRAYVDAEERERRAFRDSTPDEYFRAQLGKVARFGEMCGALAEAEKGATRAREIEIAARETALLLDADRFEETRAALDAMEARFGDDPEIVRLRSLLAMIETPVQDPPETDRTAMVRSFLSEITPEQERLDRPGVPSPTALRFRVRLVLDEVAEMLDELYDDRAAVDQLRACFSWFLDVSNWRRELYAGKGLAKVAREATDVAYAIEGLLATCGIDGTAVFRLVDSSNVAKKGAERDASGKIGKPTGWIAPDVEGELRRQGWKR